MRRAAYIDLNYVKRGIADVDRIREEAYEVFETTHFSAVCSFGYSTVNDALAELSSELGNAFAVLSPGNLYLIDRLMQEGDYRLSENCYYATRYLPGASDKMNDFSKAYFTQYSEKMTDNSINGLEAMYLLEQAISATESALPSEIREVILTHEFSLVGDGSMHFKETGEAVREVYIAHISDLPQYYIVDPYMNIDGYVPGGAAPVDDTVPEVSSEQIAVYYIGFQYTSDEEREIAHQKLYELMAVFEENGIDRYESGEMSMEIFMKYASDPYYNDAADAFVAGQPMIFDRSTVVLEFYDAAEKLGDYEISDVVDIDGICGIVMRVPH